jgi:hypothetical protein
LKYWRGYLTAGILALITVGLMLIADKFSMLVDMVYPFVTREFQLILSEWSSTVNFTLWQVLVVAIVLTLAVTVVLMITLKWNFVQWLGWVLAGASCIWLLHTGIYGLNYYAGPISEDVRLGDYEFTSEDLEKTTIYFRDKANEMAQSMPRDDNGMLIFSDFETLAQQAGQGFQAMTYEYSGSVFAGSTRPVKKLSWADFYSSVGITGVHMALTGEAAVNPQTPVMALPFTMCHEMAHRMCIATEDDANFAAFLACLANESPQFQYSAYYMAYRYCYSALYSVGAAQTAAAAARINLGVNAYLRYDLKMYDRFFSSHRNETISDISDVVNDTYIKVSGDENGVDSYNQVSIYLVNWYLEEMVFPYEDNDSGFDPMDKDQIHGILGN